MRMPADGQVRVLIVDDDPEVAELLTTVLALDGRRVDYVSDPMTLADNFPAGQYHLVILDIMMPGIDGIDLLRRIRKVDNDVAVVIYTGYPSIESAVEGIKHEVADYLQKPANLERLRNTINELLRKRGLDATPEELLHRHIGGRIRKRRQEKSMTLKDLAMRTGLSTSLISMIERAESSASIASLHKIAVALEMPMSDLFQNI